MSSSTRSDTPSPERIGRMIEDNYPIGFKLALHRKDLGAALELAENIGEFFRSPQWPQPSRTN